MELAQAEVRNNPRATLALRKFSYIRLKDAEKGVHALLREEGLECGVHLDRFNFEETRSLPYVKLSNWVKLLLDTGMLARCLVGVPTLDKMTAVLKEWWTRFRNLFPEHGYIAHCENHGIPFEKVIPVFAHADDGRSYKHLGIWILSTHGCLGRGTSFHVQSNRHKEPLQTNSMGANFLGTTWTTQFVFTTVMKTVYSKHENLLADLAGIYAEDCSKLLTEGVLAANGQDRVYVALIGFKADLPMLQKMGCFKRCWSHVPRQASSRTACQGCCHLCLGGREGAQNYPFEDFRPCAKWTKTLFQETPWDMAAPPTVLTDLPLTAVDQMDFFKSDFWHNWHLGVSKHFLGSCFAVLVESDLEVLPRGSVEKRFEAITEMYRGFHRDRNVTPFLSEISRDTMTFPSSTSSPVGRWSKALVSTELMLFLDDFCGKHIKGKVTDELLNAIVT